MCHINCNNNNDYNAENSISKLCVLYAAHSAGAPTRHWHAIVINVDIYMLRRLYTHTRIYIQYTSWMASKTFAKYLTNYIMKWWWNEHHALYPPRNQKHISINNNKYYDDDYYYYHFNNRAVWVVFVGIFGIADTKFIWNIVDIMAVTRDQHTTKMNPLMCNKCIANSNNNGRNKWQFKRHLCSHQLELIIYMLTSS